MLFTILRILRTCRLSRMALDWRNISRPRFVLRKSCFGILFCCCRYPFERLWNYRHYERCSCIEAKIATLCGPMGVLAISSNLSKTCQRSSPLLTPSEAFCPLHLHSTSSFVALVWSEQWLAELLHGWCLKARMPKDETAAQKYRAAGKRVYRNRRKPFIDHYD